MWPASKFKSAEISEKQKKRSSTIGPRKRAQKAVSVVVVVIVDVVEAESVLPSCLECCVNIRFVAHDN